MPYTSFRLIGYQIPTAVTTAPNTVVSGWDAGVEPPAVADIPVPAGLTPDDARIRLKRLAAAVDTAYTQLQSPTRGDMATTLKIFLVPEFYLRPPDSLGDDYAGSTYPVSAGATILDALDGMFVDAKFRHWLFVCGTLLWNTAADTKRPTLYFNTAVIVRGGIVNGLNVVEKRVPSSIDGIPVVAFPNGANFGGPGWDGQVGPFLASWPVRRRHVLDVGGIAVGIEVCLDHFPADTCKVLKHVVADWAANPPAPPLPGVQLHILTAGGMPIQAGSVAAKVGGYILRNDGMVSNTPRVQLQQVTKYTGFWPLLTYGANELNSTAVLAPAATPVLTYDIPATAGARLPDPPAGPTMRQQLVFFAPAAIP